MKAKHSRDLAAAAAAVASRQTILVALCGQSPAVITETVWALANETPPVVPDRVVVLTTRAGRQALVAELLDSGVWKRLRRVLAAPPGALRLGNTGDAIRVFAAPDGQTELDDLVSVADNAAAGDTIVETLRGLMTDRNRIVLSIAGGRKTMSALAALCLSLVGRDCDRLCHVLVNDPFDQRLDPRFYFPDPDIARYELRDRDGCVLSSVRRADADIRLFGMPFPRLRPLVQAHFNIEHVTYSDLIRLANARLAVTAAAEARIQLDPRTMDCAVNARPVSLSAAEFVLLWLLVDRAQGDPAERRIFGEDRLATALKCKIESIPRDAVAPRLALALDPNASRSVLKSWCTPGSRPAKLVSALEKKLANVGLPRPFLHGDKGEYRLPPDTTCDVRGRRKPGPDA